MTTNRILRLLMVATTCLLFTSCFHSKVPLSDPGSVAVGHGGGLP